MLKTTIQPMLATMAEAFDSPDYLYEIKWDGYRCLAFLNGATRLQSRNLKDITTVFPELNFLHQRVKQSGCVLDGEIIALRNGKPSFLELQKRGRLQKIEQINRATQNIPVIYVVFDLLCHQNRPLFSEKIENRKSLLAELLIPGDEIVPAKFIERNGIRYFQAVSKLGLEGVIAKKKGSAYLPGKRVKTWLKFKRKTVDNFIICGFVVNPTSRGELRSLILGSHVNQQLRFFGMVGTGFTNAELKIIHRELETIKTDICPFTGGSLPQKNTYWTKPLIVCEVEYLELTDEGSLRHPSFKRIRPDLRPSECRIGEDNADNYFH